MTDPSSSAAFASMIAAAYIQAFGRRQMGRIEWCETVRRMEDGSRFSFDFAPYQREIFEAIDDPSIDVLVLALASRLGKTETILNDIGYRICEEPRRMIMALPTIEQASDRSKDEFTTQLVGPTPPLAEIFGDGSNRRMSSNTIGSKEFPGGKIDFTGLNVAGKLRKMKASFIAADEIDAILSDEGAGKEGDPLKVLFKRGAEYEDTIKILASYPSLKGQSRIWSFLEQSDFRKLFVRHSACGHEYVLHDDQLEWPKGAPEKAQLICPGCDGRITPAQWRRMWRAGQWRPTNPTPNPTIRGYQLNAMAWPHPVQGAFRHYFHQVAHEIEAIDRAENPEDARRVFINTFRAECYEPPALEKPESDEVWEKREPYHPVPWKEGAQPTLPPQITHLTAGVDPNKLFISVEVLGHGANDETWGILYHDIHGPIDDPRTWRQLERLLNTKWLRAPREAGADPRPLPIAFYMHR